MKRLSAVTARHIYQTFGMNGIPEEGYEFDTEFLNQEVCHVFEDMKDKLIEELPKRVLPSSWSRKHGEYKFTEKGCLKLLKHVFIIQKEPYEIIKKCVFKPEPNKKRTRYMIISKQLIG
tara:strand:+ start:1594 stop:1950 length:357 start_codon:yes stop_codon:yes gene_type:complete